MLRVQNSRGFFTWWRLRRLVVSKPTKVLDQAKPALRLVAPSIRPRLLALVATALRRTGKVHGAAVLLREARIEAESVNDRWAVAEIAHRSARVTLDLEGPQAALDEVCEAVSLFTSLGDDVGVGISLTIKGQFYAHLQQFEAANSTLREALTKFPAAEASYRFAAMMDLARVAVESEDLPRALGWARAATLCRGTITEGARMTAVQTLGLLAFRQGYLEEADQALQTCRLHYLENATYLECAYVTVCQCEVLLASGAPAAVTKLAKEGMGLIGHLNKHRAAAAVMVTLANQAVAGREITAAMLAECRETLEKERKGTQKI